MLVRKFDKVNKKGGMKNIIHPQGLKTLRVC